MADQKQREQNSESAQLEMIMAERRIQAALKYLAAAREQLAVAQIQITHLEERMARTTAERAETAPPLAISVAQATKALGVNDTAMYRLLMRGDLGSIKIGKRRIVPIRALEAFIERGLAEEF